MTFQNHFTKRTETVVIAAQAAIHAGSKLDLRLRGDDKTSVFYPINQQVSPIGK